MGCIRQGRAMRIDVTPQLDKKATSMRCQKKYLRVDRRRIAFLKFIFEAYDGIANLTTIDAGLGVILSLIHI